MPSDAQVNVLEEAKLMIPDTRQRLEGALQDLTSYVVSSVTWPLLPVPCLPPSEWATCPD